MASRNRSEFNSLLSSMKPAWVAYSPLFGLILAFGVINFWLPMWREDMFIDGLVYAAIAKNLSLGIGTLWDPFYSETHFAHFYDHLPLAIYFESWLFRWLGPDSPAERIYNVAIAGAQIAVLAYFWLQNAPRLFGNIRCINAWSVSVLGLIWLLIPLNTLYVSNHLEASLTLFSSLASLLLLGTNASLGWFIVRNLLGVLAMDLAFFCNGPAAFFPLCIPLLRYYCLAELSLRQGLHYTMGLTASCCLTLLLFYYCVPDAWANTQHYLLEQLIPSVAGVRQLHYVGLQHAHVLVLMLRAYWLVSCLALGSIVCAARLHGQSVTSALKRAWSMRYAQFFLLLAIAASLPVGISHRQAFSYLMQSAPAMTLSILCFCYESVEQLLYYVLNRVTLYRCLYAVSLMGFVLSGYWLWTFNPQVHRHHALLQEVRLLIKRMPVNEILSASPAVFYQWYPGAYLARYSMLSLTPELTACYYLALTNEQLPAAYQRLPTLQRYFQLAKRIDCANGKNQL